MNNSMPVAPMRTFASIFEDTIEESIFENVSESIFEDVNESIFEDTSSTIFQDIDDNFFEDIEESIFEDIEESIFEDTNESIFEDVEESIFEDSNNGGALSQDISSQFLALSRDLDLEDLSNLSTAIKAMHSVYLYGV